MEQRFIYKDGFSIRLAKLALAGEGYCPPVSIRKTSQNIARNLSRNSFFHPFFFASLNSTAIKL